MSLAWVIGGSAVLDAGVSLFEAGKQGKISNQALGLAQDTQAKQDRYDTMLQGLLADPAGFLNNPLFTSTLKVGEQGVNRAMAAQGFKTSGNQMAALQNYGQSFASGQLFNQESLLASLSGATNASSPSQGLGVASGAASAQGQSLEGLAGMMAFLGTSGMFKGGGSVGIGSLSDNIFTSP